MTAPIFLPAPNTTQGQATKIGAAKDALVYTNGRSVFIRSLTDPGKHVAYHGHVKEATVAKVSPGMGAYCASADVTGTVRIWDLAGSEQILKTQVRPISGRVNDLAWDGEAKRIVAVGEGKERFGHAFSFDTGSAVGEISGHSKVVNAVALRPNRPFRAATAGDDHSIVFLHGVPYKFNKVIRVHSSFVHSLDYSASGSHFASASADRSVFLFDGSTGDVLTPNGIKGHQGGVFAVSFSPDSKALATSSADRTCRTWDVETQTETGQWQFEAQQVGGCHVGDLVASVSLDGSINVIDKRQPGQAAQTLHGHQKGITALHYAAQKSDTFFSGSYDGRINAFSLTGECKPVSGAGHGNQVVAIAGVGDTLRSAGMDDTLREIDPTTDSFKSSFASTGSLPRGLAIDANGTSFLVTNRDIQVLGNGGQKEATLAVDWVPTAVAYSAAAEIAVGSEDGKVYIYSKALKLLATIDKNRSAVTALAYSPDGKLLAAGESSGKILVLDTATREVKISQWVFHTGRIASIQFSQDGQYAVSASLDTNVYVWSVAKPMRKVAIKNAHADGVNAAVWVSGQQIATAGADACIRTWDIKLPV